MRHVVFPLALLLGPALLSGPALLLSPAAAAPDARLGKVIVDVEEQAQPVREVLQRLQRKHGLNYVVSEQVLKSAGLVTVSLKRVPLDAALEAICSACGLNLEFRGPILVILPKATRALPAVRAGVVRRPNTFVPAPSERAAPNSTHQAPRPKLRRTYRKPMSETEQMAVGSVLKVDLKNGFMQMQAAGVKRDFYLPQGPDTKRRSARLGIALGNLKLGNRVALLFRVREGRNEITQLIGGTKPRGPINVRRRRGPRGRKRPVRPLKRNPKTAPEPGDLPPSVLVGTFLERQGEVLKIKRADGKVLECHLPPLSDDRRKRVEAAVAALKPQARVFMMYEHKHGKYWITDSGITEQRGTPDATKTPAKGKTPEVGAARSKSASEGQPKK